MNENVRSGAVLDLGNARKCRVHGLVFDRDITDVCPLCEHERVQRIAGIYCRK